MATDRYPLGVYKNNRLKGICMCISDVYIGYAKPSGIYGIYDKDIISKVNFKRNLDTYMLFNKLQESHKLFYIKYYNVDVGECPICFETSTLHLFHTTRPLSETGDAVQHRACKDCVAKLTNCPLCSKKIETDYKKRLLY